MRENGKKKTNLLMLPFGTYTCHLLRSQKPMDPHTHFVEISCLLCVSLYLPHCNDDTNTGRPLHEVHGVSLDQYSVSHMVYSMHQLDCATSASGQRCDLPLHCKRAIEERFKSLYLIIVIIL